MDKIECRDAINVNDSLHNIMRFSEVHYTIVQPSPSASVQLGISPGASHLLTFTVTGVRNAIDDATLQQFIQVRCLI